MKNWANFHGKKSTKKKKIWGQQIHLDLEISQNTQIFRAGKK